MLLVLAFVLAGGFCMLVLTGVVQLLKLGGMRAVRAVRRTALTPVGSWRSGPVAAEAATEHGSAGLQVGPISGEDCTWYHLTVERYPARGWTEERRDVLLDVESPGWPTVSDRSGRVAVDPRMLALPLRQEPDVTRTSFLVHSAAAPMTLPPIVPPELVADLGRNESLQLTEVRLPYLAKVYVLGRATGSPVTLVPRRRGLSVCTTDNRDRVLAARRTDVADARWISRWFGLTGLVLTAGSAGLLYALI